jgi:UDP-GlcNAc3NAcA epimerase
MKKIITIVGARPQIIKASALSRAIKDNFSDKLNEIIVHTGQHYDSNMSEVFFKELGIPEPQYNLNVGSGSHAAMTAKMLEGLERIFLDEKPDAVLVYGDTNSTLAGSLAAAKIHIPVIHVEAGLRSFNKSMPEELNRIACDHMSTLLFTPTEEGLKNLAKEGFSIDRDSRASIDHPRVYKCGDVMYDNSLYFARVSEAKSGIMHQHHLAANKFILVTVHRDSNTDIAGNLESIFKSLLGVIREYSLKVVLPLHPRTASRLANQLSPDLYTQVISEEDLLIIPPAGFLDMIALEKNAKMIITDSGGVQKEAFFFKKPCVILREQTEWVELTENGNAILAAADENRILSAFRELFYKDDFSYPEFFGKGDAALFICKAIIEDL